MRTILRIDNTTSAYQGLVLPLATAFIALSKTNRSVKSINKAYIARETTRLKRYFAGLETETVAHIKAVTELIRNNKLLPSSLHTERTWIIHQRQQQVCNTRLKPLRNEINVLESLAQRIKTLADLLNNTKIISDICVKKLRGIESIAQKTRSLGKKLSRNKKKYEHEKNTIIAAIANQLSRVQLINENESAYLDLQTTIINEIVFLLEEYKHLSSSIIKSTSNHKKRDQIRAITDSISTHKVIDKHLQLESASKNTQLSLNNFKKRWPIHDISNAFAAIDKKMKKGSSKKRAALQNAHKAINRYIECHPVQITHIVNDSGLTPTPEIKTAKETNPAKKKQEKKGETKGSETKHNKTTRTKAKPNTRPRTRTRTRNRTTHAHLQKNSYKALHTQRLPTYTTARPLSEKELKTLRAKAAINTNDANEAKQALFKHYKAINPAYAELWLGTKEPLHNQNNATHQEHKQSERYNNRLSLFNLYKPTNSIDQQAIALKLQVSFHLMNCGIRDHEFKIDNIEDTQKSRGYHEDEAFSIISMIYGEFIRSNSIPNALQSKEIAFETEYHLQHQRRFTSQHYTARSKPISEQLKEGRIVSQSIGWNEGRPTNDGSNAIARHTIRLTLFNIQGVTYLAYANKGGREEGSQPGIYFFKVGNPSLFDNRDFLKTLFRGDDLTRRRYIESLISTNENNKELQKKLGLSQVAFIEKTNQRGGICALASANNAILINMIIEKLKTKPAPRNGLRYPAIVAAYNQVKPLYKKFKHYSRVHSIKALIKTTDPRIKGHFSRDELDRVIPKINNYINTKAQGDGLEAKPKSQQELRAALIQHQMIQEHKVEQHLEEYDPPRHATSHKQKNMHNNQGQRLNHEEEKNSIGVAKPRPKPKSKSKSKPKPKFQKKNLIYSRKPAALSFLNRYINNLNGRNCFSNTARSLYANLNNNSFATTEKKQAAIVLLEKIKDPSNTDIILTERQRAAILQPNSKLRHSFIRAMNFLNSGNLREREQSAEDHLGSLFPTSNNENSNQLTPR